METALAVLVGVGLSAACGFRVFVPLLVISIGAMTGHINPVEPFGWLGSWYALISFAVATVIEVVAFYIPWLDNLLDTIATPTAVVAGTIVSASMIGDISPYLKWSLAVIAGGGAAGLVQGGTVLVRGASTALTGGLTNFVVSTAELIGSIVTSILAIVLPVVCIMLLLIGLLLALKMRKKLLPKGG